MTAQVTSWKRNTRSKSKCSTFPQRNITSQGHKKQILKEIDGLILKIRKIKGIMMLARFHYNESVYIKLWVQNVPNLQAHVKNPWRRHSCTSLPSPLPFNVEIWFQSYVAKTTLQRGRKTTWSKNTSASRFLNEFMGLRYMYLVRSYFALNSLHLLQNSPILFTQKGVRIIYCESRVRAVSSLCLFMPPLTDKWRKPKTWPHVCLPMFGQEVGLKREGEGVSGEIEGWGWKGNGRGRGRDFG